MSRDRSWMYNRLDDRNFLNQGFLTGIYNFLDFAFSDSGFQSENKIRCPCKKCSNRIFHTRDIVGGHLCKWGFINQYYVWEAHGEQMNDFQFFGGTEESPVNFDGISDEVENPYTQIVFVTFDPEFQNEGSCSEGEAPNREAAKFYQLLQSSDVVICEGIEQTVLEFVLQFLHNKSVNNVTDDGAEGFLKLCRGLVKEEDRYKIPHSIYKLESMMKKLGFGCITIDVCYNNCFLYYQEGEKYVQCPICHEPRYEKSSMTGKKIPRKRLWYLPITPRLQRLYMSQKTAKHMIWHKNCDGNNNIMIHPACGEAWKHFDRTHSNFAIEARNVRLGLSTDGFNPHGHSAKSYSCWPVFITPYNLPPDLLMNQEHIFLSLIISGPENPGKNIDVMLRPLIDELNMLWSTGVETYDSFRKQNFVMRAALMWTISDFPAYGMLSGWSTHGRLSCPYCMERTKAFRLTNGHKISFFDCHRQFLPEDHQFRRNKKDFLHGKVECDCIVERVSGDEIFKRVQQLCYTQFGTTSNFEGFGVQHNWKKISIFWELSYWSTLLIRHNLDVMHCEKNFFDNIFVTVMGDPDKTKDNDNARRDLELHTRRKELFLKNDERGRVVKQKSTYTLSKDQKKLVCDWLKELRFLDGYASNISRCVNMPLLRLDHMKSHDCHVFMQRLLPIAFHDFLPENIWGPLTEVSNFFRALSATEIRRSDMESLEKSIVETICKLEKFFPPGFFDSMEHLAVHLPYEAKVGGPVRARWMYPFERRIRDLKRSVRNKARVEGSICEVYLISEITHFCSHYFGSEVQTRLNRPGRNEVLVDPSPEGELSIFTCKGRSLGPILETRTLTAEEYKAIELYVLINYPEVDGWLSLFDDEMSCAHLDDQFVSKIRTNQFVSWFKHWVRSDRYEVDSRLKTLVDGPEWTIKTYKGYFVNGYKFHTESHGRSRKTMNSGISVKASTGDDGDQINFYGMLQEVVQITYWGSGRRQTIFLFKCDWYDITRGMIIHPKYHLVDINPRSRLSTSEPFIFASQAAQVYYTRYPSGGAARRRCWWADYTIKVRHVIDISSVNETYQDTNPPPINSTEEFNDFEDEIHLASDEIEIVNKIEVAGDDELNEEEEFDEEYEDSDDGQKVPEEDDIDAM